MKIDNIPRNYENCWVPNNFYSPSVPPTLGSQFNSLSLKFSKKKKRRVKRSLQKFSKRSLQKFSKRRKSKRYTKKSKKRVSLFGKSFRRKSKKKIWEKSHSGVFVRKQIGRKFGKNKTKLYVLTLIQTVSTYTYDRKHLIGVFSSREYANDFIKELMKDANKFRHLMKKYYDVDGEEENIEDDRSIFPRPRTMYRPDPTTPYVAPQGPVTPEEFMTYIPSGHLNEDYDFLAEFIIEEVPVLQSQTQLDNKRGARLIEKVFEIPENGLISTYL